ncbi:MAG: hypothetical protein N3A53_00530 [Verrucomicrobiae bacterium]|nr:hypothetical protein [Verrucomicrobiae bacterium]
MHILSDIEALCDEVAFIERGRCVRQNSIERLTHRAQRVRYGLRGAALLGALQALLTNVHWRCMQTNSSHIQQATDQGGIESASATGIAGVRRSDFGHQARLALGRRVPPRR